jgi:hypothetical protein
MREHTAERRYLAIVRGQAKDATIESWLVRDRGDGRRGSGTVGGQHAVTHVRVVEDLGDFTLVECRLETGRTHQVRIHLGDRGTPLCGERVYDRLINGRPLPDDPHLLLARYVPPAIADQLVERALVTNRVLAKPGEKIGIEEVGRESAGDKRWVVTNLDPRESALDRVTPDELQEALGVTPTTTEDEARQAALALAIPPDALRPDALWTRVAWLLLLVLTAELLLAGRVHA